MLPIFLSSCLLLRSNQDINSLSVETTSQVGDAILLLFLPVGRVIAVIGFFFYIDSLRMVFSLLLLFLFIPSIAASSSSLSSSSTFLSVSLLLREEEPIPGNPVMVLLRVYVTVPIVLRPALPISQVRLLENWELFSRSPPLPRFFMGGGQ